MNSTVYAEMVELTVFVLFSGNNEDKQGRPIDQKSNQWFGATLTSTGRNGAIMVST